MNPCVVFDVCLVISGKGKEHVALDVERQKSTGKSPVADCLSQLGNLTEFQRVSSALQ